MSSGSFAVCRLLLIRRGAPNDSEHRIGEQGGFETFEAGLRIVRNPPIIEQSMMKVRMLKMLHEYTISMLQEAVDEAIEKLNMHGYYNSYYDQPIEQYASDNGYGVQEIEDGTVDLKVIIEEESIPVDVEKEQASIAAILTVAKEKVHYQLLDTVEWQEPFPIIDLQNGWFIKPVQEEQVPAGKIIHFEPPRAFGSGLHGTTQDCLRLILREEMKGMRVLDIGTGAGLLSIGAALSGASEIQAIDMEDVGEEVLYNARLNGVESNIKVSCADALNPKFGIDGTFDWIFINIAANEIKQLFAFVDRHLAAGGRLILSGMVTWNEEDALKVYQENGYQLKEIHQTDEWVTAYLIKSR